MYVLDRLSTEMKINYMDLFGKTYTYHAGTGDKSVLVRNVFTCNERDFLACVALEYLKGKDIRVFENEPNKVKPNAD